MNQYIEEFKLYLRTDEDLAENSIKGYERDILGFLNHPQTPNDLSAIRPHHIRQYIKHLEEKGRKRSTISRSLCALKSFFNYLEQHGDGIVTIAPTKSVKCAKRERSLPKALSEEDVLRILNAASTMSIRDRLLIELMYGLGGRVSEVISLTVNQIVLDESNPYVVLRGKGRKERQNPIHKSAASLIKTYLEYFSIKDGYLFPHRTKAGEHMTRSNAWDRVKKAAALAGVEPSKVSPHVFRHSYATHLLENGCNIAVVQELLGHEDISTTKIYAPVTLRNKQSNFTQFHPLASVTV